MWVVIYKFIFDFLCMEYVHNLEWIKVFIFQLQTESDF